MGPTGHWDHGRINKGLASARKAHSAKCNSCRKIGHYAVVCGSRSGTKGKIREIVQEEQGFSPPLSHKRVSSALTDFHSGYWISSAPEVFQRMIPKILIGLEGQGVIVHMDDILIHHPLIKIR